MVHSTWERALRMSQGSHLIIEISEKTITVLQKWSLYFLLICIIVDVIFIFQQVVHSTWKKPLNINQVCSLITNISVRILQCYTNGTSIFWVWLSLFQVNDTPYSWQIPLSFCFMYKSLSSKVEDWRSVTRIHSSKKQLVKAYL